MTNQDIVKQVCYIYKTWFGVPICTEDKWLKLVEKLQKRINDCGITLPVPVMDLNESRPEFDIPEGNPLDYAPVYKEVQVGSRQARYAGRVAQMLHKAGHPVFYVNHSLAISAQYSGNDGLVRDVLTTAPVVVYNENKDGRKNGWVKDLLLSRQSGIAVVVRAPGREDE